MRVALDTNVLAYAEGVNGEANGLAALDLISRLPDNETYVPLQSLGELFNVLVRKARLPAAVARGRVLMVRNTFLIIPTTPAVVMGAMDLATDHRLNIWDAVIVAAASSAGCQMMLSEDMQDGFIWGGVRVVNPFAPKALATLARVIGTRLP